VTNINFALESMSRDLRTATNIRCQDSAPSSDTLLDGVADCPIGNLKPYIAFYSTRSNSTDSPACDHGLITVYAFMGSNSPYTLQKAEQTTCLQTNYSFSDLISPIDMSITNYQLGVLAPNPTGAQYPLTFIRLTGYAGAREKERTYVDVETAISARSAQ